MPGSNKFGYSFPECSTGYDFSSYNPAFSDGVVTQQDIESFMFDLHQLPNIKPDSSCDPVWLFIPLAVFLLIIVVVLL